MTYIKNKAFTLIELLVAISIIGLLSSIVLVSLKGTREKAKIAKSLEFSHSIQHVLGSEAVGIWSFDEGSGTTAQDSSGYGNTGTIYGGASYTPDTPHSIVGTGTGKYALSFDGVDDWVDIDVSNYDYERTTVLWINPNDKEDQILIRRAHCDGVYFSDGNLKHAIKRADHANAALSMSLDGINTGQWNFIATSVNLKTSTAKIVINGEIKIQNISLDDTFQLMSGGGTEDFIAGAASLNTCPMTSDTTWFNGKIDEVRIYNQALTQAEIQKHYVEGLERYSDLALSD